VRVGRAVRIDPDALRAWEAGSKGMDVGLGPVHRADHATRPTSRPEQRRVRRRMSGTETTGGGPARPRRPAVAAAWIPRRPTSAAPP